MSRLYKRISEDPSHPREISPTDLREQFVVKKIRDLPSLPSFPSLTPVFLLFFQGQFDKDLSIPNVVLYFDVNSVIQ